MNRDHLKKILEAARNAASKTNVEHEQEFYAAVIEGFAAELGEDTQPGVAAPASSGTPS